MLYGHDAHLETANTVGADANLHMAQRISLSQRLGFRARKGFRIQGQWNDQITLHPRCSNLQETISSAGEMQEKRREEYSSQC